MIVAVSILATGGLPLLLWAEQAPEAKRVEIFVEGKKYNSVEEYREEESNESLNVSATTQTEGGPLGNKKQDLDELQDMFAQAVRHAQRPLDLKFDPRKIKTFYLKNFPQAQQPQENDRFSLSLKGQGSAVADPFTRSYAVFHQAGFNTGVNNVVGDFTTEKDQPADSKRINTQDIQRVLQESFGVYDGPLLLMSDQKKLRVMVLEPSKAVRPAIPRR